MALIFWLKREYWIFTESYYNFWIFYSFCLCFKYIFFNLYKGISDPILKNTFLDNKNVPFYSLVNWKSGILVNENEQILLYF